MTPPSINDHLKAVQEHLIAADIPCGYGKPPDGHGPSESWTAAPGQSAFAAYAFVSKVGGKETRIRTLDGDIVEARPIVNVQCVGGDFDQVEEMLDQVKAVLDAQTLVIPGRVLLRTSDPLDVSESTRWDYGPDLPVPVAVGAVRYRPWTDPGPDVEEPE